MLTTDNTVRGRLAAADRERQKEAGGRWLLRSLSLFWAVVLAAFVLDAALHLAAGWRLGILLALLAAALAAGARAWHTAFVRRNPLERIARWLESRDPSLGSRLINLLQLQSQVEDPSLPPLTRSLARQAVEAYARDLSAVPIEAAARTGEAARQAKRAAWAFLVFAAILAACFRVTALEFARFLDPFGDHPPYSFTRLEILDPGPAGTNVLYDHGLVVKVRAMGHQPREVILSSFPVGHPEQALDVPMFDQGGAGFHQVVDHVRGERMLVARTRDGASRSRQVRVGVVLTPQLEKAFVTVAPPAYTGLAATENPYQFQGVQALEGSEVRFRFASNRPLRNGVIEVVSGDQPPRRVSMVPTAEREVAGAFMAAESGRLRFSLIDTNHLPSQGDWEGPLTVTHDLPPEVRITDPDKDAFIAADLHIEGHIEAGDDYGLRSLRVHVGLNGTYPEPRITPFPTNPVVRDAHDVVDLSPAAQGAHPGDTLSIFAEAIDNAPEPHVARSQTVQLKVISVEAYNSFLREQTDLADTEAKYGGLLDDLRDLVEEQRKLAAGAKRLEEELARQEPGRRGSLDMQADDLAVRQNELNHKLGKLADRMEHFVRENPVYDAEKELQATLRKEADTLRASAATNSAATRDLARTEPAKPGAARWSPESMASFRKAGEAQADKLGGSGGETEKQIAQTLDDLRLMQELQKDFAQFEELYHSQEEVALHTQAYNHPGALPREDQLALKDLAAREKEVGDLLGPLEQKLRQDAAAADQTFPKAARSGRELADKLQQGRFAPTAHQATDRMLAGDGEPSHRIAERLRADMEKLFSQCKGGNGQCPDEGELDDYLRLQLGQNPGHNFAQMGQSRKFPHPGGKGAKPGTGQAGQAGQGGSSGFAMADAPAASVLGNEQAAKHGAPTSAQSSRFGKGAGATAGQAADAQGGPADTVKALNPINRQSGAVASENVPAEYVDLVDSYFRVLTAPKKP